MMNVREKIIELSKTLDRYQRGHITPDINDLVACFVELVDIVQAQENRLRAAVLHIEPD